MEAPEAQVSIEDEWKSVSDLIEVPTGKHARVRRRPLTSFYKSGKIPNSLMGKVKDAFIGSATMDIRDFTDEQIKGLLVMIDMIVIDCTETPRVYPEPICVNCDGSGLMEVEKGPAKKKTMVKVECSVCEGRGEVGRENGRLYIDEIPFNVKNYIYNYVIGVVDDLESFREQFAGDVESLSERADLENPAEQSSGSER